MITFKKSKAFKLFLTLIVGSVLFTLWWHQSLYPRGCFPFKRYPIHLTFDDGPVDNGTTSAVLNALNTEHVLATFFVSGEQLVDETTYMATLQELVPDFGAEGARIETVSRGIVDHQENFVSKRFDLLDRMLASGHLIASHSFLHIPHNLWSSNLKNGQVSEKTIKTRGSFKSESAMSRNIYLGKKVLEKYLNPFSQFIRMPFGAGIRSNNLSADAEDINRSIALAFRSQGFQHIGLDIDSRDWKLNRLHIHPETGETLTFESKNQLLISRLLGKICETRGGIIAFHDIEELTGRYIRSWIKNIRIAGHYFVSLKDIAPRCFESNTPPSLSENIEFHPDGKLKQCWQSR